MSATSLDGFFGGRLMLHQPATGHRVGTDAALLAAAIAPAEGERVVDLGAGVGAVGLAIAAAAPGVRVTLVEIDPAVSALAADNIVANGLGERVTLAMLDLTDAAARRQAAGLGANTADHVVMNPPFHAPGTARPSPSAYRERAHIGLDDSDDGWSRAAASLLRPGGSLTLIHRADALPRLLAALAGRFGDIRILPVLPTEGAAAVRVLVRAVKGSRGPLVLLPPLVLHGQDGRFTLQAQALHRGEVQLDWQLSTNNARQQPAGR